MSREGEMMSIKPDKLVQPRTEPEKPAYERHQTKAERAKNKPGRFWARSSAGVMLNQRHTIGWRGVNPQR